MCCYVQQEKQTIYRCENVAISLKQLDFQAETLDKEYEQLNTTSSPINESKFTIYHHPKPKAGCTAASSMNDSFELGPARLKVRMPKPPKE
jgi:hypothetical protein